MLLCDLERGLSVRGSQDRVAAGFETFASQLPHRVFVLHKQYRLRPAPKGRRCLGPSRNSSRTRGRRKIYFESSSLIRLTVNPNIAIVLFNDSVNRRKPEAGTFPRRFGREERLEDVGLS